MSILTVRPETRYRDWNDVRKAAGRFIVHAYQDDDLEYDLTHRVEYAVPAGAGILGSPLDRLGTFLAVKNMGKVNVLLYLNTAANVPGAPFEVVIKPGCWVAYTSLDIHDTQPRIRVDSALYSAPCECEVLQIGYHPYIKGCDMWAVGHVIDDGAGTKHYPEAGIWANVANPLNQPDRWLADVAGVAVADYWAVGYDYVELIRLAGVFARWDGLAWEDAGVQDAPPQYGVWGFAADDYWSVGGGNHGMISEGVIWHWDGVAWSFHSMPEPETFKDFYCVHGSVADHVYAAGEGGIVARWDGLVWTPCGPQTENDYYGTWTSETPETWCCGGVGASWWGIGETVATVVMETAPGVWSEQLPAPLQELPTLRAMWGFSDTDIWCVGDYGTIIHWDGVAWSEVAEPDGLQGTYHYRGVFGCSADSVWAIGSVYNLGGDNIIIHWDGAAWTVAHGPNLEEMELLGLKGVRP